jgi:serine protease Do
VTVVPLTQELAERIGFSGALNGVVVKEVEPGSLADRAVIRPGDVIVAIGSTLVKDVTDYRKAIAGFDPDKGVRLQLVREGIRRFVFLRSVQ